MALISEADYMFIRSMTQDQKLESQMVEDFVLLEKTNDPEKNKAKYREMISVGMVSLSLDVLLYSDEIRNFVKTARQLIRMVFFSK